MIISFRITRSLVDRIDQYRTQHRKRSRTEGITDLLQVALLIMDRAQNLDEPAMVKYFQEKLYDVQIVDDVMQWDQGRIEAMLGVLMSERERRLHIKLGKHYHM